MELRCKKCGKRISERRIRNTRGGTPEFCSDKHQSAFRVARFRSKAPKNRQDLIHLRNLVAHGMVAEKLLQNEQLIDDAIATVSSWLKRNGDLSALREWLDILETRNVAVIITQMIRVDEEGMRLRSSSPFTAVLSEEERAILYTDPRAR